MGEEITIRREWAMPNSWTFEIGPIQELVEREVENSDGLWIDPFAGKSDYADITNDLDPERDTDYTMKASDFLEMFDENEVDGGVLFDPPYSPRQISEMYNKVGLETSMETTQATFWSDKKSEVKRIVDSGATVLTFGWNSGGMGKTYGFTKREILLVPHGGWHNDTICVVEQYDP